MVCVCVCACVCDWHVLSGFILTGARTETGALLLLKLHCINTHIKGLVVLHANLADKTTGRCWRCVGYSILPLLYTLFISSMYLYRPTRHRPSTFATVCLSYSEKFIRKHRLTCSYCNEKRYCHKYKALQQCGGAMHSQCHVVCHTETLTF